MNFGSLDGFPKHEHDVPSEPEGERHKVDCRMDGADRDQGDPKPKRPLRADGNACRSKLVQTDGSRMRRVVGLILGGRSNPGRPPPNSVRPDNLQRRKIESGARFVHLQPLESSVRRSPNAE